MTYRQLLRLLSRVVDDHLDEDVTIYDKTQDEFYRVDTQALGVAKEGNEADGILDDGNIYLIFETQSLLDAKDDFEDNFKEEED